MTNSELLLALGRIDDRHVEFAAAPRRRRELPDWLRWVGLAAAACLVVLSVAILSESTDYHVTPGPMPGPLSKPLPNPLQEPTSPNISLSELPLNPWESTVTGTPPYYDPALYTQETWDEQQIADYLGRDLTLPWAPEGMTISSSQYIVRANSGELVRDVLALSASDESRGLYLTVSRLGMLGDCVYLLPDSQLETAQILNVDVTLGHRVLEGRDCYVAEFVQNGVRCQLRTEGLPLADAMRALAGVILGTDSVTITE